MDSLSTPRHHPAVDDGRQHTLPRRVARPPVTASGDSIRDTLSELRSMRPATPRPGEPGERGYAAATVGNSEAMQRLRSQINRIAPYFRTALILGNPGTGKEGVARMLHALSPCAEGNFIPTEAAALAHNMNRNESSPILDAIAAGAEGLTIFLDEVGEVPLTLQGALLRLWTANGRGKMRVVAGTHRDLRTMGVTGQFRPDLAQRLMGIELTVPPLLERREDLPAVLHEALRIAGGEREMRLSDDAMARLLAHRWAGDLGEVNDVLRAAVSAAGRRSLIEAGNLPELRVEAQDAEEEIRLEKLEDVVRQHVLGVLTRCGGNKLRAAEVLGISRSTLYRMLETCISEGFAVS